MVVELVAMCANDIGFDVGWQEASLGGGVGVSVG
jgi:hypothetical protein